MLRSQEMRPVYPFLRLYPKRVSICQRIRSTLTFLVLPDLDFFTVSQKGKLLMMVTLRIIDCVWESQKINMEISLQASLLQGSYGKIAKVENNPKASLLNGRLLISPISSLRPNTVWRHTNHPCFQKKSGKTPPLAIGICSVESLGDLLWKGTMDAAVV